MTDEPEGVLPTDAEREAGKLGVARARDALAHAAPPSARSFVPLPPPKPIDPSEPREREEP